MQMLIYIYIIMIIIRIYYYICILYIIYIINYIINNHNAHNYFQCNTCSYISLAFSWTDPRAFICGLVVVVCMSTRRVEMRYPVVGQSRLNHAWRYFWISSMLRRLAHTLLCSGRMLMLLLNTTQKLIEQIAIRTSAAASATVVTSGALTVITSAVATSAVATRPVTTRPVTTGPVITEAVQYLTETTRMRVGRPRKQNWACDKWGKWACGTFGQQNQPCVNSPDPFACLTLLRQPRLFCVEHRGRLDSLQLRSLTRHRRKAVCGVCGVCVGVDATATA